MEAKVSNSQPMFCFLKFSTQMMSPMFLLAAEFGTITDCNDIKNLIQLPI